MKRVLATSYGAEMEVLRQLLQEADITCVLRNGQGSGLLGTTPFAVELWVERDEDFAMARELYEAWCKPVPETVETWNCPECGQQLAPQFDSCWQCGTHRTVTAPAPFADSNLPCSWADAIHRGEEMSSVLDSILHQAD